MLHDKLNLFKVDILIDATLIPFPAKFTCSNSTIGTLEQGVKYVQS